MGVMASQFTVCFTTEWLLLFVNYNYFRCVHFAYSLTATTNVNIRLTVDIANFHFSTDAERCRYSATSFRPNPHKRHPIARPWGRVIGVFRSRNVEGNKFWTKSMVGHKTLSEGSKRSFIYCQRGSIEIDFRHLWGKTITLVGWFDSIGGRCIYGPVSTVCVPHMHVMASKLHRKSITQCIDHSKHFRKQRTVLITHALHPVSEIYIFEYIHDKNTLLNPAFISKVNRYDTEQGSIRTMHHMNRPIRSLLHLYSRHFYLCLNNLVRLWSFKLTWIIRNSGMNK